MNNFKEFWKKGVEQRSFAKKTYDYIAGGNS